MSWTLLNVTQVAESGFKKRHIQLQTSHYSSSILPHSQNYYSAFMWTKTPLTAVDGLFSLMAFRGICFKLVFKSKHIFIAKRCFRKYFHWRMKATYVYLLCHSSLLLPCLVFST